MALDPRRSRAVLVALVVCSAGAAVPARVDTVAQRAPSAVAPTAPASRAILDSYCVTCHNQRLKTAGLVLDAVDVTAPHANPEIRNA